MYDATSDVHTINPVHYGVIDVSDNLVRSTLVVKSVGGIVTIPINGPLVESKSIFEVHNTGTQTENFAFHGFQEKFERFDDNHVIGQGDVVDEKIIVQEDVIRDDTVDEQIIV